MVVLQLPPRESLSSRVSFESLYGMWFEPPLALPSALIQFERASRDLLMLAPSCRRTPLFIVLLARSEPARSMSESLPTRTLACTLAVLAVSRTVICSTACEREETAFACVALMARFPFPRCSIASTSSDDLGECFERPATWMPLQASSRRLRPPVGPTDLARVSGPGAAVSPSAGGPPPSTGALSCASGASRSRICSLYTSRYVSCSSKLESSAVLSMAAKRSSMASTITPGPVTRSPIIVCVFPAPVAP
mmetsp:Transcript_3054/g.8034  ORF Transcript_3054/g.8034 Transcript_3054/m.8034 type:complete len:251 (-) Transcript_3054:373-1125(-)